MDKRSVKDSTVLSAGYHQDGECVETIRATSEAAYDTIAAHGVGVGAISEDKQIAQRQTDNVLC